MLVSIPDVYVVAYMYEVSSVSSMWKAKPHMGKRIKSAEVVCFSVFHVFAFFVTSCFVLSLPCISYDVGNFLSSPNNDVMIDCIWQPYGVVGFHMWLGHILRIFNPHPVWGVGTV